ncbi:MAG TPA: hypothetical protein VJM11_08650 [Nevskiaceae bacterium]|nr:hypothetical protein [Nevskiaceae bacterium]
MKLGPALLRLFLLLLVVAAAGQYWLVQRSHEAAKRVIARLIPYGELRYDKLWPWPWGAGRVWNVSFQPEGLSKLFFLVPDRFRMTAREVRIDALGLTDDGLLDHVRGTLVGVEIPVSTRKAGPAGADPAADPLPTLHDLGYTRLALDVDFQVQYLPDENLAVVKLNGAGPELGRFFLSAQLEGTPATFSRTPDQVLVRRTTLELAEGGVLSKLKAVAAARSHLSRPAWEQAMIAGLDRKAAAAKWQWDAESAQAVRRAIRDSDYFTVGIDPPGDVVLRNIRLYPVGDWPALLGFTFAADGAFDHPPPGDGKP